MLYSIVFFVVFFFHKKNNKNRGYIQMCQSLTGIIGSIYFFFLLSFVSCIAVRIHILINNSRTRLDPQLVVHT